MERMDVERAWRVGKRSESCSASLNLVGECLESWSICKQGSEMKFVDVNKQRGEAVG